MYQFVIQAVVQGNTLMQSCCWKNTGTLLSAKKVIIICFRIFLLNRCLALTSLSRPPGKPSPKAFIFFSRQPGQLCHETANIIYYDVGLPLDPTGGISMCTRVILFAKGLETKLFKQTYYTSQVWCFSSPQLGGRQSQSQDVMLHLSHKLSDHGVCTKNLV